MALHRPRPTLLCSPSPDTPEAKMLFPREKAVCVQFKGLHHSGVQAALLWHPVKGSQSGRGTFSSPILQMLS